MAKLRSLDGKYLNDLWNVHAKHALYREDGKWYHQLKDFPGALFDANGYIVFETKDDYLKSPHLQIQKDLHVHNGISSIPSYVRVTENNQLQRLSRSIKKVSESKKAYVVTKLPKGQQQPKRSLIQAERVIRDTQVGLWVKYIHEYCCQICGMTLQITSGQRYAEAHHIQPLGKDHNGPDVVENVLCVCPNHHILLDYAVISIDKSKLRYVDGHEINENYINYHNSIRYKGAV
jgi:5-methylcytosine-specific restriction enzyme A